MSRRDIAVVVKETPVHIVEVRTGIQGKQGIRGEKGDKGDKGEKGEKGDVGNSGLNGLDAQPLVPIYTDLSVINVNHDNCGTLFICTNNQNVYTQINVEESPEDLEVFGDVVFFTQHSEKTIQLNPIGNVTFIVANTRLPETYEQGSTIGIIATAKNTWAVVGDLAFTDIEIE